MLFYKKESADKRWQFAVWEITETVEELSSLVADEALVAFADSNFGGDKRKCEWLATRLLLRELMGAEVYVEYDSAGRPFINGGPFLSISHTDGFAAILLSLDAPMGIDIELVGRKAFDSRRRYMSSVEMESLDKKNPQKAALLGWMAKEALFKIVGNLGGTFKDNIIVAPFECAESGSFELSLSGIYADDIKYFAEYYSFNSFLLLVCSGNPICR